MTYKAIMLRGAIVGTIWQGIDAGKRLEVRLERVKPLDVSHVRRSLYDMIADVLNDGDFQSAKLSADSWIEVIRSDGDGRRRRTLEAADLPSIADLVDEDRFASDFE